MAEATLNKIKSLTPYTITGKNRLLQELREVRKQFVAIAEHELTLGFRTTAVPTFDQSGAVETAFGVSYPIQRTDQEGLEKSLSAKLIDGIRLHRQFLNQVQCVVAYAVG